MSHKSSIIVIHGDNLVASRNRLTDLYSEFSKEGLAVVTLPAQKETIEQIMLAAQTNSLLGEERVVIVAEFFSGKGKSEKGKENLEKLSGIIVFWQSSQLSKSQLAGLPKTWKIEHFRIPQTVFKLLDALVPTNTKLVITILHQILEHEPEQLVLSMLSWHVRQLIWAKVDPQTLNLPNWRKEKLTSQAARFTKEQLFTFHTKLLELDRSQKTGTAPLPFLPSLDFLIVNL